MNEPDVIVGIGGAAGDGGRLRRQYAGSLRCPAGSGRQFTHTTAISRSSAAGIPGCAFAFRQRSRSPTAINAGTHIDALCMHYNDFADLVKPTVGTFAKPLRN